MTSSAIRATVVIASVALLVAVGVAIAIAVYSNAADSTQGSGNGHSHGAHEHDGTRVYRIETFDAFDVSDERKLVGFADNVFLGRVSDEAGTEPLVSPVVADPDSPEGPAASVPQTQFSVEVLDNIKGRLEGTVTVSQTGARVPGEDAVVLAEGDPLLRTGETVLFATKFDRERQWHQITTANYADVRVEGPTEHAKVVDKFEAAENSQVDPLATQ